MTERPTASIRNVFASARKITLVVLAAGFALAGCSGGGSTAGGGPNGSPSSPPVARPTDVAVSATDLGPGWQVRTIAGGTQVQGQVTLDLCGGGYRSEALRAARLQIAMKRGAVVLSNEVVRYRSGGARLAYQELTARMSNCPHQPVTMPEAGGVRAVWTLRPLGRQPGWLPDTVAVRGTVSAAGHTTTSVAVYQFDGDWLAAVYSENASGASVRAAERAATIEARKLRALIGGTAV